MSLLNQVGPRGSALQTLRRVTFHEGFWALWRGNSVNVLRMIPNKGVLLACSDLYKEPLRALERNKFWHGAASGALAGATAALLTYPLDLARSRMAGCSSSAATLIATARASVARWRSFVARRACAGSLRACRRRCWAPSRTRASNSARTTR